MRFRHLIFLVTLPGLTILAGCAAQPQQPAVTAAAPPAPPPAAPAPSVVAPPAAVPQVVVEAPKQDFATFLAGVRAEALSRGFRAPVVQAALTGVQPIPRIIELDRKQPEFTATLDGYLRGTVSDARVAKGRQMMQENKALLDQISRRFGVQPRFIVALWGIETNFGSGMGGFRVVNALATLAYDGRRSAYFRTELMNALQILDEGHIAPDAMIGSWAGAMGQTQLMPSSFLKYAVDFDGDGHRNIWGSRPDALASAANYLSTIGWKGDETWGREVRVPASLPASLVEAKTEKPLSEWQSLGVRRTDGGDLPARPIDAYLIRPGTPDGPAYLVYANFKAILNWNRSNFFGVAVGTLADRLGDG